MLSNEQILADLETLHKFLSGNKPNSGIVIKAICHAVDSIVKQMIDHFKDGTAPESVILEQINILNGRLDNTSNLDEWSDRFSQLLGLLRNYMCKEATDLDHQSIKNTILLWEF